MDHWWWAPGQKGSAAVESGPWLNQGNPKLCGGRSDGKAATNCEHRHWSRERRTQEAQEHSRDKRQHCLREGEIEKLSDSFPALPFTQQPFVQLVSCLELCWSLGCG